MTDTSTYRVLSVKKRRRNFAAVRLSAELSPEQIKCERDTEGALLIDYSLAEEGRVADGRELTFDDIAAPVEESYIRRAVNRALWFLSSADCSAKALYNKLRRAFPDYAASRAVERMTELGYVDDERFARRLCEAMTQRGVSERELIGKLISKGIPANIARSCVRETEADPAEQLKLLIEKKYLGALSDESSVRRTVNALARKGFEFSDIRAALKDYIDFDNSEDY